MHTTEYYFDNHYKQFKPIKKEKQMNTQSTRETALNAIGFGSLVLAAATLFILTACSTTSPPPPAASGGAVAYQEGVPGGVIVNTVDISARVTAIDQAKREITLLGPDGEKHTVTVGPEAVNFDQVKVGDLVKATVTEELVIYLDDEGAPASEGEAGVVALAPKGAKPEGLMAQTRQVKATVTKIDQTKRTATLRFDDGTTEIFPVREDIDLDRRKVGDRVVFRVTEMIAISVEKQ